MENANDRNYSGQRMSRKEHIGLAQTLVEGRILLNFLPRSVSAAMDHSQELFEYTSGRWL